MTQESDPAGGLRLELPFEAESAGVARQAFEGWVARQAPSPGFLEDCRLVLSELVGNAIKHAHPLSGGLVELRCACHGRRLDIAVTDGGASTRPQKRDAGPSDVGGRGLAIVEALSSSWWVEASNSRTTVHASLCEGPVVFA